MEQFKFFIVLWSSDSVNVNRQIQLKGPILHNLFLEAKGKGVSEFEWPP